MGLVLMSGDTTPYAFDPEFTHLVIALLVEDEKFQQKFGAEIDPDAFPNENARIVAKACRAITLGNTARSTGGFRSVAQKINRFHLDGEITEKMRFEAVAYLMEATAIDISKPEGSYGHVREEIQIRMLSRATHQLLQAKATRSNPTEAIETLSQAERLGEVKTYDGNVFGADALAAYYNAQAAPNLATGVPSLDDVLGGGATQGGFFCYIGDPGAGKSMALVQAAVSAARQGKKTLFVSHEIGNPLLTQRVLACMTGVPLRIFTTYKNKDNGPDKEKGKPLPKRVEELIAEHEEKLDAIGGCLHYAYYPPCPVNELLTFVRDHGKRHGVVYEVLVDDYPDKLDAAPGFNPTAARPVALNVYDTLRNWAQENNTWLFGASQPKNKTRHRGRFIKGGDFADSIHKIRIVDQAVSINHLETHDQDQAEGRPHRVQLYVIKNRQDAAEFPIPPIYTNFESAQLSQVDSGGFIDPRIGKVIAEAKEEFPSVQFVRETTESTETVFPPARGIGNFLPKDPFGDK